MEVLNRNYSRPLTAAEAEIWGGSRKTHPAVAQAIHAIADPKRSPASIWEAPTPAERDLVAMAVEEYITQGDYTAAPDDLYQWGLESIRIKRKESNSKWP
jgi:hypothetical protein